MLINRISFLKRCTLIAAAVVIGGCSLDVGTDPDPEERGRIVVTIKDENNTPVSGILVDLFLTTTAITPFAAATTDATGTAEFAASVGGVAPRSYFVRVITLTTYTLAAGETNNKPVTVVANQTATVTFTLSKRPIVAG